MAFERCGNHGDYEFSGFAGDRSTNLKAVALPRIAVRSAPPPGVTRAYLDTAVTTIVCRKCREPFLVYR